MASLQTSEGEHQHAFLCSNIQRFYFPPSASKDRAINIIEIKDFIILWTYSQCDVCTPSLSREELRFASFPFLSFLILERFRKVEEV